MQPSKAWTIKEPQISARGAKSCTILNSLSDKVIFNLGIAEQPTRSPFGATSFGDEEAVRKTIEFDLDETQELSFTLFDNWAINYLKEHSEQIFKKQMSREEVVNVYKSPVSKKADYKGHLRCKIRTQGQYAARCWNTKGERIDMPHDLRNIPLCPRIHASHLWMMSREVGWVFHVTDLQIGDLVDACPFSTDLL